MGIALIKLKIMPTSPESNLEKIKEDVGKIIKENKGLRETFEEQPIAFGLKAVIANFDLDENDELEPIENKINSLENVNSAEVIDMRRAFG